MWSTIPEVNIQITSDEIVDILFDHIRLTYKNILYISDFLTRDRLERLILTRFATATNLK